MTINTILIIEPDSQWHEIYRREFQRHLPGVEVACVAETEAALALTRERRFDLYTTNYLGRSSGRIVWEADDLLRQRVAAIRELHPDAQIALVSAGAKLTLERITEELGIGYFRKQDREFIQDIAAHYGSAKRK